MLPKTTATAASGETAIGLVSIGLPVSTGDVVTAYIDGLAGDTTTPDVVCEWFEVDTLRPTTADRTLDVSVDGDAEANVTKWLGTAAATPNTAGVPKVDATLIEGTDATDALTAAAEAALASTDTTVGTIAADVTTLLSRLSAARAGYLDVLAGWTGTLRQALRAMTSKGAGEASADLTASGGTYVLTTDSLEAIRDRGDAAWTTGSSVLGTGSQTVIIECLNGAVPVDGCAVWVTTDSAGTNVVAGTLYTDAFGRVTVYLDPGTYYIWRQIAGVNYTNPQTIVVTS